MPVNRVRAFEDTLLGTLRTKHMDVLDTIRSSKDLSSDAEAKLKSVVASVAKSFV
jgi:F-type H+-transporting ATPase subunit alpha